MNILENCRILRDLSSKIHFQQPLLDEEMQFIAIALGRIGNGEDANIAFGVKYARGRKLSDELDRQRLSVALHMVSALVDEGLRVDTACNQVSWALQANIFDNGADGPAYDGRYLYNSWSKYPHMRRLDRTIYDADFPYGN